MKFSLEIYEPGSSESPPWLQVESDKPFPSIHAGDLVDPLDFWEGSQSPKRILRVTAVQHLIWPARREEPVVTKYKLMVFTEEVENSDELRHPGKW